MKKFLAFLLIAAIIAGGVYAFIRYKDNMPHIEDLEVAKKNLEDADCEVTYIKKDDIGGSLMLSDGMDEALYASSGEVLDPDAKNLVIIVWENKEIADIYYDQIKNQLTYQKKSLKNDIDRITYELKNDELTEEEIDELEEELDENKEDLENLKDMVVGKKGNIFWYGSKELIEASRP